ncbi:hypothetical protein WA026_000596 [Henosepilachna vigintioctopunctata]|uniref:KATNIP domain-containing protein n=1 Tax=Henosepilachna vigintioctopunctata TaxID=420089 RepID=A0AAW1UY40_9CUCU
MNPNTEKEDKSEPSKHTPHQSPFPKWLEEISSSLERSHTMHPKNRIFCFGDQQKQEYSQISSNIPSRIPTGVISPNETEIRNSEISSPKYGRRSISTQLYFENTPKNLSLTSSDYLVPKFENPLDYTELLNEDIHQSALEKSWRSLNAFQQSHKGRLDSAKEIMKLSQDLAEINLDSTDISNPLYQEQKVPNGSMIVNYKYIPYTIERIKKNNEIAIDNILENTLKVCKSKSSDCIVPCKNGIGDCFGEVANQDERFKKKVEEYKMNVAKEYQMRKEIINELFDQNEKITEKIRRKSLHSDNLYRTPEYQEKSPIVTNKNRSKYTNKPSVEQYEIEDKHEEFIIPELPTGKMLVLDIRNTWGDKYYVGLNGIEIYESCGKLAAIRQVEAYPPDVNILPEYTNDPRVVNNLFDGVNRTQDDMHIWLAPFYKNEKHVIKIVFQHSVTLGMIRIWNYNKSRIHSYRGVKDLLMYLDEKLIFQGEIARASGIMMDCIESLGDTILFTTDDEILERISCNDPSYNYLKSEPNSPPMLLRPETANLYHPFLLPIESPNNFDREQSPCQVVLGVKRIDMCLISNWGHHSKIGFTGLEVIEVNNKVINLGIHNISSSRGTHKSHLERLFNNDNLTVDPRNMWCTQYFEGSNVILTIKLDDYLYISGIRIWNYNENLDSSAAGVRVLKIYLDNKLFVNPNNNEDIFLLRRAPGNLNYDFVQEIFFSKNTTEVSITNEHLFDIDDDILMGMPQGFVYQFIIYSTWGDQYYCGLNGIEIFDEYGRTIILEDQNICAYPESVNVLPQVSEDVRTPDKLIDGINDSHDGSHSWLAPIISKHLNRLYIVMDRPVTVSYMNIWNYSKTPNRGVKDFGILVDDLLVYSGTLRIFSPDTNAMDCRQTVLFTHDKRILGSKWNILIRSSNVVQEMDFIGDEFETTTSGSLSTADPSLRPFTSVQSTRKPYTSKSQ